MSGNIPGHSDVIESWVLTTARSCTLFSELQIFHLHSGDMGLDILLAP